MKSRLLPLLGLCAALSCQAVPVTYEFSGTFTAFRAFGLPDLGFGAGSAFSALLTFDPELAEDKIAGTPDRGIYFGLPVTRSPLTVTVGGYDFVAAPNQTLDIYTSNQEGGDGFIVRFGGAPGGIGVIDSPWDFERGMTTSVFGIDLSDSSGAALQSKSLFEDIAANGWPEPGRFWIEGGDARYSYRLTGDITDVSCHRVPEAVPMAAASLLLPLLFAGRHRITAPWIVPLPRI